MNKVHLQLSLVKSQQTLLDVNLSLPGRGVCGIIGFSGAGKTTLLRAVAGLDSDVRGRVDINGDVWQDDAKKFFLPTHRRSMGYVFQEPSLFSHLTVQQNLEFGVRRVPSANQKVSLSHAVELLDIAHLLNRSPATLSGGEKQRVGIARALATSPNLLLMDEPLASLDEQRKGEILPYLERLHNELEIPVLYVSHAMDEIEHLADYVVVLEQGRSLAQGKVMDVLTRADLPFSHGDQAFVLVLARVVAQDAQYQLSEVEFSGGRMWLPWLKETSQHILGETLRIRVAARDVSLSSLRQTNSSILNSLEASVVAIEDDAPGLVMVTLDAAGTKLLARIAKKSADHLVLRRGMTIFAQIKGAAIK